MAQRSPRPLRAQDLPTGTVERLFARVATPGHHPSVCWLWEGYRAPGGYGHLRVGPRHQYVHRVVYALLVGPIPAGREVDHVCFQPACVRPSHLRLATRRQNARGQRSALSLVCRRGHVGSLRRRSDGRRRCAECLADWWAARGAA